MLNNKYLIINILFNASALILKICIFNLKIELSSEVSNFLPSLTDFCLGGIKKKSHEKKKIIPPFRLSFPKLFLHLQNYQETIQKRQ